MFTIPIKVTDLLGVRRTSYLKVIGSHGKKRWGLNTSLAAIERVSFHSRGAKTSSLYDLRKLFREIFTWKVLRM